MSQSVARLAASLWRPPGAQRPNKSLLRVWDGRTYVTWSSEEWQRRALRTASALRGRGIQPGDRVACLLTNTPPACSAVLGVWYAGACLVSLPLMPRGMDPSRYLAMVRRMLGASEAALLTCEGELAQQLAARGLDLPVLPFERLDRPGNAHPSPPDENEVAFVQFSSGSTTEPRGCMLTPRAIAWQLESVHLRCSHPDRWDTSFS